MAMDNKLNRAEIAVIVAQYFSDSNFEYSRIESGSSNSTYRISVNEQAYVLSIFESKGSDHVAELTSILSQLEDRGIRSSRVIAAVDGRLHSTFNGKPILLKEYISGESFRYLGRSYKLLVRKAELSEHITLQAFPRFTFK